MVLNLHGMDDLVGSVKVREPCNQAVRKACTGRPT